MGITFKQLYNRLIGAVDVIPNSFAKAAVNDALRQIYDERDWGFLWKTGYIKTPAVINGTASVEKFSSTITLDVNTANIINSFVVGDVPLEERQVKFYGTTKTSRNSFYNIVDYDSVGGIATLDRDYVDDTNAAIKIQILKAYYTAPYLIIDGQPEIDFRRFGYVYSHLLNKRINIDTSLEELNQFDPTRSRLSSVAYPAHFVPRGLDSADNMLYEFYPHPTQEAVYETRFLSNGRELKRDSDSVPTNILSVDFILSAAKQKAYEWVITNSPAKNIKVNAGYGNLIALAKNDYSRLLQQAVKKDEELFPQAYLGNYSDYDCADYLGDYNPCFPHDRFGDTLVIDAAAPTIEIN